jgi:hypothetical protein
VGLVACTEGAGKGAERESVAEIAAEITTGSFANEFALIDSVIPEQPREHPIVRLSGIDMRADGSFLIGDVSEANVKLFDSKGRLVKIIGRKGKGPGEFISPRFPRFGPDGRIYVADAQLSRLQVFARGGEFERVLNLPEFARIMGFEVLRDGTYAFLASGGTGEDVLFRTDASGKLIAKSLPIAQVRPAAQKDHEAWSVLRSFSLAVRNDTALVSSSVSDSLWRVDLVSGNTSSSSLRFPGYVKPDLPSNPPPGLKGLLDWANSVHTASTLSVGSKSIYLPFVQGVLNYGDPMIVLWQTPAGRWRALDGAPPIVYAFGDTVVAIQHPDNQDPLVLGYYTRK